jgi:S-formylglutathione hydrolase FrmB
MIVPRVRTCLIATGVSAVFACSAVAAGHGSPSPVPSVGPAGSDAASVGPASLPPAGQWRVTLSTEELVAAGAPPDGATAGTYTWTFDGARARIDLEPDEGEGIYCRGTMASLGDRVKLSYELAGACGDSIDELRWELRPDGLHLFLIATTQPLDMNRAFMEAKPWQPVAEPSPAATIGEAADDGARIVKVDTIDARTRDLTIESPSVGTVTTRLILPSSFDTRKTANWPVLFLLHGCCDTPDSWMRETDVESLTAPTDLLVVTPDGGDQGWYTDWKTADPDAPFAPNQWETFHLTELPQLLERNYRASDDRVIAGLSMGGYGALNYASRHPEMFKAAASYSGVLDLKVNPWDFTDPESVARWGDPVADAANWDQHNPVKFVDRLMGMPLYVAYGNGQPGPLDLGSTETDELEEWIAQGSDAFVAALKGAGVPATVNAYGAGTHSWVYWQRELHESLPMLLRALGEPVPASPEAPTSSVSP